MHRLSYFIRPELQNGTVIGAGPITQATFWEQTFAMDRAGSFKTFIPLADPAAVNIFNETVLRCYVVDPQLGTFTVGSGVVDDIRYVRNARGSWGMLIQGLDELRLLQDKTVHFLQLGGTGSPPTITHAAAVNAVESFAPSGWVFNADPTPPFNEIIYRFRGQSVLAALTELADFTKTHFFLSGPKTVSFRSTFASSNIIATTHPPQGIRQDPSVCFIQNMTMTKETKDISTRIYGYGGWYDGFVNDLFVPLGDVNYNLSSGNPDYWPTPKYAGYTHNLTQNYIQKDTSVSAWGIREKVIQYPQIKVTFFTGGYSDEIWRDLARLIYNRTVTELDRYSQEVLFLDMQLVNCNIILQPLTTIKLSANIIEDGRSVLRLNDDFIILSSKIEVTGNGVRTTHIEVANAERYRRIDPYTTAAFRPQQFTDNGS